jgi:hypothetical protein
MAIAAFIIGLAQGRTRWLRLAHAVQSIRQLWGDEATHNYRGGDATGNAAFAPKLPTKPRIVTARGTHSELGGSQTLVGARFADR